MSKRPGRGRLGESRHLRLHPRDRVGVAWCRSFRRPGAHHRPPMTAARATSAASASGPRSFGLSLHHDQVPQYICRRPRLRYPIASADDVLAAARRRIGCPSARSTASPSSSSASPRSTSIIDCSPTLRPLWRAQALVLDLSGPFSVCPARRRPRPLRHALAAVRVACLARCSPPDRLLAGRQRLLDKASTHWASPLHRSTTGCGPSTAPRSSMSRATCEPVGGRRPELEVRSVLPTASGSACRAGALLVRLSGVPNDLSTAGQSRRWATFASRSRSRRASAARQSRVARGAAVPARRAAVDAVDADRSSPGAQLRGENFWSNGVDRRRTGTPGRLHKTTTRSSSSTSRSQPRGRTLPHH